MTKLKILTMIILININLFEKWVPIEHDIKLEENQQAKYQNNYNKLQGDFEETQKRRKNFIDNHKFVAETNQASLNENKSLRLEINEQADLTLDEFMGIRGGLFQINKEYLQKAPSSQFQQTEQFKVLKGDNTPSGQPKQVKSYKLEIKIKNFFKRVKDLSKYDFQISQMGNFEKVGQLDFETEENNIDLKIKKQFEYYPDISQLDLWVVNESGENRMNDIAHSQSTIQLSKILDFKHQDKFQLVKSGDLLAVIDIEYNITEGADTISAEFRDTLVKVASLNSEQIESIQATWEHFKKAIRPELLGVILFKNLFTVAPDMMSIFQFGDGDIYESEALKKHALGVILAIDSAISKLNTPEELSTMLKNLGERHRNRNILPDHQVKIAMALQMTLDAGTEGKLDIKTGNEFSVLYHTVMKLMLLGSHPDLQAFIDADLMTMDSSTYLNDESEDNSIQLQLSPESLDWRETSGILTPVKDQGDCGACWAFSALAVVESRQALKSKQLQDMSEQELIDCDDTDWGCGGGWPMNAFKWLETNSPVLEKTCPYKAQEQEMCCMNNKKELKEFKIVSSKMIREGDSEGLIAALNEGPVSSAVAVSRAFQFQSSGVMSQTECPAVEPNHAVTTIGYTPDYWIIRNSWSQDWGEKGYIRLSRKDNTCSIQDFNSQVSF